MKTYDVFNGDADGICALIQLRLAAPCESSLVTGIKRDIKLLSRVDAQSGDHINVLDISLDKNRDELLRNLSAGAEVFYVDHHFAGEIPSVPNLKALIDTDANICTSLLINQHLNNQFPLWAVTAAFGDNLKQSALSLAGQLNINEEETQALETLGTLINYNGYGAQVADLHFAPDDLFLKLLPYKNPLDVINDPDSVFMPLKTGYEEDYNKVTSISAEYETDRIAAFILPDETWSRRISGVYSNDLANASPDRAHAVLTHNAKGGYLISVRAPLNNKTGADELCRQFATGGGRKAAAGINHLEKDELNLFFNKFSEQFS
jgi:hypothetical protein